MKKIKIDKMVLEDLKKRKTILLKGKAVLTGNIFIDKPWVVNFPEESQVVIDIHDTMYNVYSGLAQNKMDDEAIIIDDTDDKYTHRELLDLIDKTAECFKKMGVKEGSYVGLMLNNTIEEPVVLLALNKIGAVAKFIDYTKSVPNIIQSVQEVNLDMFVLDEMMMPLEPVVNSAKKPVVVANTNRKYRRGNYLSFKEFLSLYKGENLESVSFDEKRPSVIINSSGTTGPAKPITHTNKSINSAAQKMLFSNFILDKDTILMKIIPPQIGLGIITSLYTGLLSDSTVALIRGANAEDSIENTVYFIKNFKNYCLENSLGDKKLVIFASPMYFRMIINSPEITDLSFVSGMMAAGSKLSKEELESMEIEGKKKGLKVPICNAYGQNELAGAVTINDPSHNLNGSAGYPVIGTDIVIVNPETYEPVKANEVGLILEKSNSEFLHYENSQENSEKARVQLNDGSTWFISNDLGYINSDGYLFITGRTSRVVIRSDFKIPLDMVEEKLKELDFIGECALITTSYDSSYEGLDLYVTLKEKYKDKLDENEVKEKILESGLLSEFEMPDNIHLINQMPILPSGKIDYKMLENMSKKSILSLIKK